MHGPPTGMAKKRKEGGGGGDKEEIMKLTQMVKAWEFTCSFCFKKFASAQAMGGHQNAHRNERLEEKRLFVRDPIGYRKRAYVRALKSLELYPNSSSSSPTSLINLHAATKMVVKHELNNLQPCKIFSSYNDDNNNNNKNKRCPSSSSSCVVMNFLPPKELCLVESVGIHADHEEADKAGKQICIQFSTVEKPDLTLKL